MKREAVILKFDSKRPRANSKRPFVETEFTRRIDRLLAAGKLPSERDLRALNDFQRALSVIAGLS